MALRIGYIWLKPSNRWTYFKSVKEGVVRSIVSNIAVRSHITTAPFNVIMKLTQKSSRILSSFSAKAFSVYIYENYQLSLLANI